MISRINQRLLSPATKPILFFIFLGPFFWLLANAVLERLGANPAEALERSSGDWALRMLCVVLAVTPIRVATRLSALARLRRMIGLFVYFYAVLHLLAYSGFDMGFDLTDIAKDIGKRPFVLVGFSALVLLSLLALTSFNRAIRWMGAKRWQTLHKSVYAVAALAILHFYWMRAGKQNFNEVFVYAAILGSLLAWRVRRALMK